MTPIHKKAILSLILATTIWGAAAPIFKWSLENVPLFSLAFLRFGLASLILWPLVRKNLSIAQSDRWAVVRIGLLGVTLNVFFFLAGLKLTLAINAAIITATIPIFTMAAAALYLREKLTWHIIFGALLTSLGILVIFAQNLLTFGISAHVAGDVLLLLAAWSWVGYEITSKKLLPRYSPLTLTFYSFVIGAITFLPFALGEYATNPLWPQLLTFRGYFGIIYGAVFSSAAAYFLWEWGLSKLPASESSLFFHLNPIAGVLVAVPLLGESMTVPFAIGAALVFSGVFLAEWHNRRSPTNLLQDRK